MLFALWSSCFAEKHFFFQIIFFLLLSFLIDVQCFQVFSLIDFLFYFYFQGEQDTQTASPGCPSVCRRNKGLFCISILSPSSLTFYCELLGDWQKRSVAAAAAAAAAGHLFTHLHCLPHHNAPQPTVSFLFTSVHPQLIRPPHHHPDIKHALTVLFVFSAPSHHSIQHCPCLGNRAHTRTHTHTGFYSQLLHCGLSLLFTEIRGIGLEVDGCVRDLLWLFSLHFPFSFCFFCFFLHQTFDFRLSVTVSGRATMT